MKKQMLLDPFWPVWCRACHKNHVAFWMLDPFWPVWTHTCRKQTKSITNYDPFGPVWSHACASKHCAHHFLFSLGPWWPKAPGGPGKVRGLLGPNLIRFNPPGDWLSVFWFCPPPPPPLPPGCISCKIHVKPQR